MHSTILVAAVLTIAASESISHQSLAQDAVVPKRLAQNTPVSPSPLAPGQTSPGSEGRSAIPNAPIGHRQPTPRDLPPDVLDREQPRQPPERSQGGSPFQIPNICTNC